MLVPNHKELIQKILHQKRIKYLLGFGILLFIIYSFTRYHMAYRNFEDHLIPLFQEIDVELISDLTYDYKRRLDALQHPKNCFNNKFLIFDASIWVCGIGCSIHQIVPYLHLSFVMNRTLIVKNSKFSHFLKPLTSENCLNMERKRRKNIFQNKLNFKSDQFIDINLERMHMNFKKHYFSLLSDESSLSLTQGRFVSYIMNFDDEFMKISNDYKKEIKFNESCAGIHVRRTDKIEEAAYHSIEEYMTQVKNFFNKKDNLKKERCVFIATDEANVIKTAEEKYPNYRFIYNIDHAKFTSSKDKSTKRLKSGLLDFYLLSQCEFVVCTLSSNIGRLIYELFSVKYDNVSEHITSLDAKYHLE